MIQYRIKIENDDFNINDFNIRLYTVTPNYKSTFIFNLFDNKILKEINYGSGKLNNIVKILNKNYNPNLCYTMKERLY
jgi:hypothetical protein